MIWFVAPSSTWFLGITDGPDPPSLSIRWRVRHLGLGVGLIYRDIPSVRP